ncbi:unnamed protein product [Camellia sinensis]
MTRKRKMEDDDKFSSDDDFFKTDDDDKVSVNDPSSKTNNGSSIDWCKFVHKVEDAKENLLKLKGETKLKVLWPFIKNSDLDLYKITVFMLHKAKNNPLIDDVDTHTKKRMMGVDNPSVLSKFVDMLMLDNGDPSDWSIYHKKIEVSRKGLLKPDHNTKLKVLWPFINNSHVDLYGLTMSELRNSTHKPLFDNDDHTHSISVGKEGSKKNGVVS